MILALRTDAPRVTIVLLKDDGDLIQKHVWEADRTLARSLLRVLKEQLGLAGGDWRSLRGLICFKGPGSFTGLRIGASVMNTIAHTQAVPIVGTSGDNWLQEGVRRLKAGDDDKVILPDYGRGARITSPKK